MHQKATVLLFINTARWSEWCWVLPRLLAAPESVCGPQPSETVCLLWQAAQQWRNQCHMIIDRKTIFYFDLLNSIFKLFVDCQGWNVHVSKILALIQAVNNINIHASHRIQAAYRFKLAALTLFLIYKAVVSCESLTRSQSTVVCGGWHLALRHSCLPPPLFSALQWDHVVLLISQQWPYSLPFPLFFPSLFAFPHSLSSSSPRSSTHAADSASHQLWHWLYKLY